MTTEPEQARSATFDTMGACASATGVPLAALKQAKKLGCEAFRHGRVELFAFLRWWFAQQDSDVNTDWNRELNRERALRERIRREADQGLVMDSEVVRAFQHHLMGYLFGELDRVFASELPPALKGMDEVGVRVRAQAEIEALKKRLSDTLTAWEKEKAAAP